MYFLNINVSKFLLYQSNEVINLLYLMNIKEFIILIYLFDILNLQHI